VKSVRDICVEEFHLIIYRLLIIFNTWKSIKIMCMFEHKVCRSKSKLIYVRINTAHTFSIKKNPNLKCKIHNINSLPPFHIYFLGFNKLLLGLYLNKCELKISYILVYIKE